MTESPNDKRNKTRVNFRTRIVLKMDSSEIHLDGNSKDLSLNGIFVYTQQDIPIGKKCDIQILLTGMEQEFALNMQGKVTRKTEEGIALKFNSIELDSYSHLKNIVRYNSDDPDAVY